MLRIEGHRRAMEARDRSEWERIRWLAAVLLQPYAAKGRTIKPADIAAFPWDAPRVRTQLTPEEIERLKKWDANS